MGTGSNLRAEDALLAGCARSCTRRAAFSRRNPRRSSMSPCVGLRSSSGPLAMKRIHENSRSISSPPFRVWRLLRSAPTTAMWWCWRQRGLHTGSGPCDTQSSSNQGRSALHYEEASGKGRARRPYIANPDLGRAPRDRPSARRSRLGNRLRVGTTRRFRVSGYPFNSVRSARKLGVFYAGNSIMKLTSNTILITGGGSGIGYELTKQLTALGNTILITGRDQSKMDRAKAAFPKIHTFRSDVSDPKAIATLYEQVTKQFPELDILINNAGIMREINIHDKAGSLEDITREIEINLSGPIRMVKQFLPHLKTKSQAAIVNVSSGLAFVPLPISPVYCATKAGLHSFTESLRVQLKNTKVKVFELAPPATQTKLLGAFNSEDMKGVSIMKVEDMVKVAVKGMQTERFEIRPGQANQLKMMSRVAPGFILKQMSRSVDRMLGTQK